jgi:hypothetical protein
LLVFLAVPGVARADAAADAEAASRAYSIELPKQLELKVGQTAQLRVTVIPNAGAHVSPEAPVSLSASAGTLFDLPQPKLSRAEATTTAAQGIEFGVPVVGKQKGKAELKASLVFYICVATLCAHQKRELSVPVTVD